MTAENNEPLKLSVSKQKRLEYLQEERKQILRSSPRAPEGEDRLTENMYEQWIIKYNRTYDTERRKVFMNKTESYRLLSDEDLNEYSDCTFEEAAELVYAEWIQKYDRPYDAGRYEVFVYNAVSASLDDLRRLPNHEFPPLEEFDEYADCTVEEAAELVYAEWLQKYNRPYDAGRYEVFQENLAVLWPSDEELELNEYADCTLEQTAELVYAEWIQKYNRPYDAGRYKVFVDNAGDGRRHPAILDGLRTHPNNEFPPLEALDECADCTFEETAEFFYAEWLQKYNRPYDAGRYEVFRRNYKVLWPSLEELNECADCTVEEAAELVYEEWIQKYDRPYDEARYKVFRSNYKVFMEKTYGYSTSYETTSSSLAEYADCMPDEAAGLAYAKYIDFYKKPYDGGRRKVFRSNYIDWSINLGRYPYFDELNEYADCTVDEAAELVYPQWIEINKGFILDFEDFRTEYKDRSKVLFATASQCSDFTTGFSYRYVKFNSPFGLPELAIMFTPTATNSLQQMILDKKKTEEEAREEARKQFRGWGQFKQEKLQEVHTDTEDEAAEMSKEGQEIQPNAENATANPSPADSVYFESIAELSTSGLAYAFSDIIDLVQEKKLNLMIPEEFPEKDLWRFVAKSMDFTEHNYGYGISLYEIKKLIEENQEAMTKAYEVGSINSFGGQIYQDAQKTIELGDFGVDYLKGLYLSYHRSLEQKVACVYSIVKDTNLKRIIVSFRGSTSMKRLITGTSRDWRMNLRPGTIRMKTPEKVRHKLTGKLQEYIRVRKGFYQYLFDNEGIEDGTLQRYDSIRKDIQTLLKGESDYTVHVTGHSLGGALAALFSFQLAGGGEAEDILDTESVPIPKPVTCITWAAPFSGSRGFRSAYEHLEREGLLRSVRINNGDDPVPTAPPLGNMIFGTRMAHVGINIRLTSSGYRIEHSSRANFRTARSNSLLKPIWKMMGDLTPHSLQLHRNRFETHMEEFKALGLDDLYKNDTIVSQDFIDGNIQ